MKKVVIFGGGSGLSQLLKGLKLFPVNITAVVSVADNGASTGRLRDELNIPAVGDISKVMLAMANTNSDLEKLMNYRFTKSKTLGNHSVKNLLLTALLDIKGNFDGIGSNKDFLFTESRYYIASSYSYITFKFNADFDDINTLSSITFS